jgi:N-glycosylase/DNA lyase
VGLCEYSHSHVRWKLAAIYFVVIQYKLIMHNKYAFKCFVYYVMKNNEAKIIKNFETFLKIEERNKMKRQIFYLERYQSETFASAVSRCMHTCGGVCVCERETDRERAREREKSKTEKAYVIRNLLTHKQCH